MVSTVDIINAALDHIGEEGIIDPSEDSPAVRRANRRFDMVRDAVLRDHNWNFASKRALLASADPSPAWGPANGFVLPADFIRLRAAGPRGTAWRVEGNQLVADAGAPLPILYTYRVSDPNLFDPLFVEALALQLARAIVQGVTQKRALRDTLRGEYRDALADARAVDEVESVGDVIDADEWLTARFVGVGDPTGSGEPWWGE